MADTIITKRLDNNYLVSELDVKTNCPLDANKAHGTIAPFIKVAENTRIRKVLGLTLYSQLVAEWIANGKDPNALPDGTNSGTAPQINDDNTNYKELYLYVYESLTWWAYSLSIPTTGTTVGEQGVLKRSTDYSQAADDSEVKRIITSGESIARTYTQDLIDYLASKACDEETSDAITKANKEGQETGGAETDVFIVPKPWQGHSEY